MVTELIRIGDDHLHNSPQLGHWKNVNLKYNMIPQTENQK